MFYFVAGKAFLRPFEQGNTKQQWIIVGDRIQNRFESNLVLDVYKPVGLSTTFMNTGEYTFHGGENQRWIFQPVL